LYSQVKEQSTWMGQKSTEWEEECVMEETEETMEVHLNGNISVISSQEHCRTLAAFCKDFV